MRYLILSDIHANLEALEAVVRDAGDRFDTILCLGDIVGYGADPNAAVEWVRANVSTIVRGNHDKVAIGSEDIAWFNPAAQAGALWTQRALTPENIEYVKSMPRGPLQVDGFQICHGSPLDEDDYLLSPFEAAQLRGYVDKALTFFGHTHVQGGFVIGPGDTFSIGKVAAMQSGHDLTVTADAINLINPGSVGQPRDGDPRAGYVFFEPEEYRLTYRRVEYDIASAQRKILEAGLPEILATRLSVGG
ncbi:MAG: metallophosphoesterase family protein [bacterium]|nr:metallophosphoesterase family protein [bacterium]